MSLWSFSVRRWQFTLVVFALLVATGLWALSAIPRAEDPSLRFPGSLVIVQYPGADPEDIERLVVDPIEDALAELEDVKRLNSTALDGLALVEIEFTTAPTRTASTTRWCARSTSCGPRCPPTCSRSRSASSRRAPSTSCSSRWSSDERRLARAAKHAENLEELIETAPGRAPRRDLGLSRARGAGRDRPRAPRRARA